VFEALCKQFDDVLIVQRVEDHLTRTAWPNESLMAQQPKLVGDSRFAQSQELRDVAYAKLSPGKRVKNPHARHVSEDPKGIRQGRSGVVREERCPRYLNI
jgi:hypothetical protein